MGTNADEYNDEDEDTHIDMDEAMEGRARRTRQTRGRTWTEPCYENEDEDRHT